MVISVLSPINRAGWPFIAIFAIITAALFYAWFPAGWAGVILTLWCVYFFRDPARVTPTREGLVISPADGVVQMIKKAVPPEEIGFGTSELTRVSIFMNVFDVHVNRIPIGGTIMQLAYRPGKFFNASLDKASEFNECQSVRLKTDHGPEIAFVQIAGLIARRIKCDIVEEQAMRTGERFGLIRFGSRVDVYLPDGIAPKVAVGQQVLGGETIMADLKDSDNQVQRVADPI